LLVICAGNTIIGDFQADSVSINFFALTSNRINSTSQFFLQTGGSLYLFSDPIPEDGKIIQIKSFGYYSDENLALLSSAATTDFDAYLFAVVFRREAESGLYQLIHEPEEIIHQTTPGLMTVEWPVQSGDLVGALIPTSCINRTQSTVSCPSRIDLRNTTNPWDCSSALFHPFNTDTGLNSDDLRSIPVDQFEEVQVHLNMEVSILPGVEGKCLRMYQIK
jgi:hypothetical protein